MKKFGINEEDCENLMRFKKADAQIKITIAIGNILKIENLSLKKANSDADYNQVDKRRVNSYQEVWGFDEAIAIGLKLFTGELNPESHPEFIRERELRDKRRMFLDELPEDIRAKILSFFRDNRIIVVNDILKGRGGLSADWMLVTRYNKQDQTTTWIFKDINTAMNFFGGGDVRISPRGSLYIGKITMQRKGGTPDPTKLQFEIKPCELFKLEADDGS
ncbi:MAG: type II restriction endonuclease [Methanosarcinales archaeon]|uniref:Type II restriction endonuclease n=1 Tax=Candidatus Ethanoperedens thermophilum TaxID=2766897 RepID=A0A848DAL3_9EURY|nr:type II restriction endonuclease [Candidatus Ethanoperedens thermophilum]